MFEEHWTGIPNVAAAIAENAMQDESIDWKFTFENAILPNDLVRKFVDQRSGVGGLAQLADLVWKKADVCFEDAGSAVGVFTATKTVRRFYQREAMVVYDLSPLLTPRFHTRENIDHFANRFRADIESSDQFFCISKAAADDVCAYFNVPQASISLIPMAAEFSASDLSIAQTLARRHDVEPYVLVVGTLEPRKNGRIVLKYLLRDPSFAQRYRVVFVGRSGWLSEHEELLLELDKAGVPNDRVFFTGYVSETEKLGLLYNASFCVYGSFFEGYGLPVLEAAQLGKMIICSNSSSMPEVAPECCIFFDPNNVNEFSLAMSIADRRAMRLRDTVQSFDDVVSKLTNRRWLDCYSKIAEWVHNG